MHFGSDYRTEVPSSNARNKKAPIDSIGFFKIQTKQQAGALWVRLKSFNYVNNNSISSPICRSTRFSLINSLCCALTLFANANLVIAESCITIFVNSVIGRKLFGAEEPLQQSNYTLLLRSRKHYSKKLPCIHRFNVLFRKCYNTILVVNRLVRELCLCFYRTRIPTAPSPDQGKF